MKKNSNTTFLYIAWFQAVFATVGSLFFSLVLNFPPCTLCWYQRICMYPLAAIFTVGMLKKDKNVYLYSLPLSIIGLVIALYHNLLYYKIIPEAVKTCAVGVSCTTKFVAWFGFITIPLLSLVAFIVINICTYFYAKSQQR